MKILTHNLVTQVRGRQWVQCTPCDAISSSGCHLWVRTILIIVTCEWKLCENNFNYKFFWLWRYRNIIPKTDKKPYHCDTFDVKPVTSDNFFSDPPTVSVTHSPDSAKKMTLNCKVVNKRFACDDVHVKDKDNHNRRSGGRCACGRCELVEGRRADWEQGRVSFRWHHSLMFFTHVWQEHMIPWMHWSIEIYTI